MIFPSLSKDNHVGIIDASSLPTSTSLCTQAGHKLLPTLAPCVLGLCVCHHTRSISLSYIIKIARDLGKKTRFRKVYKRLIVSLAYINN